MCVSLFMRPCSCTFAVEYYSMFGCACPVKAGLPQALCPHSRSHVSVVSLFEKPARLCAYCCCCMRQSAEVLYSPNILWQHLFSQSITCDSRADQIQSVTTRMAWLCMSLSDKCALFPSCAHLFHEVCPDINVYTRLPVKYSSRCWPVWTNILHVYQPSLNTGSPALHLYVAVCCLSLTMSVPRLSRASDVYCKPSVWLCMIIGLRVLDGFVLACHKKLSLVFGYALLSLCREVWQSVSWSD